MMTKRKPIVCFCCLLTWLLLGGAASAGQPPDDHVARPAASGPITTTEIHIPLVILPQAGARQAPLLADGLAAYRSDLWAMSAWSNPLPPFWNTWRPDRISFAADAMRITLNAEGCPGDCDGRPYAAGEYRTQSLYGPGVLRARLKASNVPGTVTALFTYTGPSDGQPHNEIDIEILGLDPTQMDVGYFTHGEHWVTSVDLGFDASQDWHVYEIAWQPNAGIVWRADGATLADTSSSPVAIPEATVPQRLMLSLWACTGVDDWCGSYGGQATSAGFDWVSYEALR